MTLAEIIAEGERLEAEYREQVYLIEQIAAGNAIARFHNIHGRTLLAVARAAVEMAEAAERLMQTPYMEREREFLDRGIGTETESGRVILRVLSAMRAFDAAAGETR